VTTVGRSRLSCSEYSFPSVADQRDRIGIVRLLGFELVDLALFLADDTALVAKPAAVTRELAAALGEHGLGCEDVFYATGSTFEEIAPNPPERELRQARRSGFSAALEVTAELGVRGITILPGISWPVDPEGAWSSCVEELAWRVEQARQLGIQARVEAHAGSIAPTPELARRLCEDVPGLRLTLDLSHFELQSVGLDRALTLVPYADHLHVRAAKPGAVQVRWRDNETDFAGLLRALDQAGYEGAYCVEYVPMEKWRCDELDVVTETIATRAALAELGVA
jgi:sugar phosphate isomerase/epimerase